jgi:hypothetical protein
VWWLPPIISALDSLRKEDSEFKASLGYTMRLYLKEKAKEKRKKNGKRE